jgi:phosphohistidine phosphatase
MRHGEAMAYESELTDMTRPLTRRGAADAAAMAERCRHEYWQPDLIVTSPARRALETALSVARVFGIDAGAVVAESSLYQANSNEWLRVVQQLPSGAHSALLIAHNPGISQFAQSLLPQEIVPGFAPATVLALISPTSSWETFADAAVALRFRATPR